MRGLLYQDVAQFTKDINKTLVMMCFRPLITSIQCLFRMLKALLHLQCAGNKQYHAEARNHYRLLKREV